MATVYVDRQPVEMNPNENLLHGCLSAGFDLPYFCWHPALGSVGACRQCAIKQFKDENDTAGKLVMACMTPVAEGARISIADAEAAEFRAAVIEGLMLNHPHDCPVCDEGGECHLQDMTVMSGHDYRRYRFEKRTYRNQYLGPFVNHEMNRCIQCYRCVRFYRDYAGGQDLNAFALRDTVYFGRHEDGRLESEFSGNLVEVCPTGVFTDATLKRHYTRKWDLQAAPSVCVHCGVGCNISPGERYGSLRRIVNRYHREVNGYFLCDRGRYGYEFVNSERRIRRPVLRGETVSASAAAGLLAVLLTGTAIGIGSPRASLESNFALRALVGAERFHSGMSDEEGRLVSLMQQILRAGPARSASVRQVELSDAVLVLGEDLPNVAPRMALALRQSVRRQPLQIAEKMRIPIWQDAAARQVAGDARGPLFVATPAPTRIDDVAAATWRAVPDEIARLGFAVARELDASAPDVPDLPPESGEMARRIARALRDARQPLVMAGASLASEPVIQAAAAVARALGGRAFLSFTMPECNSAGLAMLEPRPLGEAVQALERGAADTVIVLENDLFRRAPAEAVTAFLERARHVVVLDHLQNRTTERAELLIPAAAFAEADGTLVNSEGRAQRFFQVFVPEGDIQESWRWLAQPAWSNLDDVIGALAAAIPALAPVVAAAPPADFRMARARVPRQPHRYSGRTAMLANITLHEPKPPDDPDTPLAFSMEGNPLQPPPPLVPFFWAPQWNSIQAVNKFQDEIAGPLRGGDSGVRLFEPGGVEPSFPAPVPPPFRRREGEWLVLPSYRLFGSDELSMAAPAIASVAPPPQVALHPDDAALLQAGEGQEVLVLGLTLPLRLEPRLARGTATAPADLLPLPAWARISRT